RSGLVPSPSSNPFADIVDRPASSTQPSSTNPFADIVDRGVPPTEAHYDGRTGNTPMDPNGLGLGQTPQQPAPWKPDLRGSGIMPGDASYQPAAPTSLTPEQQRTVREALIAAVRLTVGGQMPFMRLENPPNPKAAAQAAVQEQHGSFGGQPTSNVSGISQGPAQGIWHRGYQFTDENTPSQRTGGPVGPGMTFSNNLPDLDTVAGIWKKGSDATVNALSSGPAHLMKNVVKASTGVDI